MISDTESMRIRFFLLLTGFGNSVRLSVCPFVRLSVRDAPTRWPIAEFYGSLFKPSDRPQTWDFQKKDHENMRMDFSEGATV